MTISRPLVDGIKSCAIVVFSLSWAKHTRDSAVLTASRKSTASDSSYNYASDDDIETSWIDHQHTKNNRTRQPWYSFLLRHVLLAAALFFFSSAIAKKSRQVSTDARSHVCMLSWKSVLILIQFGHRLLSAAISMLHYSLAYNNVMEEWKTNNFSVFLLLFIFISARNQSPQAHCSFNHKKKKPHITLTHTSYQRKGEEMIGVEKERSFENYEFQNRRQHKLLHVFKVREEKTMENLFSQPFVKILLDKFSVTIWSDGLRSKSSGAIAMEENFSEFFVVDESIIIFIFIFQHQHHLAFYGSTLLMGGWNFVMNIFYDFLFSCFMCVWGWASAELRFHGNWKLIFLQ